MLRTGSDWLLDGLSLADKSSCKTFCSIFLRRKRNEISPPSLCYGVAAFFSAALQSELEMTPSKFATRSGFQVFFECSRFAFGRESDGCFDLPGTMFKS